MSTETGWIAISGHIVGSQARGFATVWESDLEAFRTPEAAIRHGFKAIGSDDFRIGYVKAGILEKLRFMDGPDAYQDEITSTAEYLGLKS